MARHHRRSRWSTLTRVRLKAGRPTVDHRGQMTSPVQSSCWTVAWPGERDALARAAAIVAAWPELAGRVIGHVRGDAEAARRAVRQDLLAVGVDELDLPDIELLPAALGAPRAVSIAHLPAALVEGCEYDRRPYVSPLPEDDPLREIIWELAARVLADVAPAVTVVTHALDGADRLSADDLRGVTLVSGSIAARRRGKRRGMLTVPRPPAPGYLTHEGLVLVDARRPDDVALAVGSGAAYVLANAQHVNAMALVALGVPEALAVEAVFAPLGTPFVRAGAQLRAA
jgi:hypothetical protein